MSLKRFDVAIHQIFEWTQHPAAVKAEKHPHVLGIRIIRNAFACKTCRRHPDTRSLSLLQGASRCGQGRTSFADNGKLHRTFMSHERSQG